ncbi:hypothetical protein JTE90_014579 [Oedothorax gibbosus]|uniref:Tudor domain-containing protein n=1 Tax=Oedothorax gibbosus TaxID=931172 RepID=A0AAV6ULD3_9ARAC|nr:hypothetical protein JTE90_014579 [Oedothorax gibbosus]
MEHRTTRKSLKLVYEKPSGMFNNGLQLEYESHFKEKLPSCWVQLIKESSTVEIDEVEVYGKVPEGANFIVRPSRIISSGSTTPSEPSEKVHTELQNSEVEESLPKAEVSGNPQPIVPALEIPAGNEWGVYITGVYATDTIQLIAARLVDSDDDFLTLLTNMSIYYNSTIDTVDVVEELRLYATIEGLIEGDLAVHRVLVTRVLDNDLVECYYVDEGTVDIVKKGDLQYLHIDFLRLPYQAMHFELDGLEDYEPFMTSEHLDSLKYKTFIAVVKRWLQEESYFPDDPSIQKVIYSVALYDTSSSEIDICLNDNVKKLVSESLICKLPKLNVSLQGYLTHVTSTGQIYVRFLHPTKSWLEAELESLSPRFEEACLENSLFVPGSNIFVAKNNFDNKWYRATIPEKPNVPIDPELLEVIFVDHGYPCFVKKSEICDLHLISEFLFSLSYQAIKCDLYNALPSPSSKWTIAASQRLIEMAPIGEELIIRVISEEDGDALPKISLHKRIYNKDDSFIISINENLACKPELFSDSSPDLVILKPPTKLNLQPKSVQPLSKLLASSVVPSISSPVEREITTPLKNLDITSPVGIQWATTPDMLKSPEDEDLSPPLTQPLVPEVGEMFDVFVTTAANPHNFIVQPLQSSKEMNDLMIHMQQFYSDEDSLIEMHPSLLQRNSFYAALHPDGAWYRVRLVSFNPSEPEEALVFYVDFGDYDNVYLQNLQKLYNQFRDLPCQAIKASLSGIMPLEVDWKPEHCVNFKSMVTEQKFVSIIKKKRLAQDQGFSSLELELTLIDTTDPEADVFIHELLITNLMARKTIF